MALLDWIKATVAKAADPKKEERVRALANRIYQTLQARAQQFTLGEALRGIECLEADLELARRQVYQDVLARAWNDGSVKPGEQKVLGWVARCLELPPQEVRQLDLDAARSRFAIALAHAMADGVLDAGDETLLTAIAASVGSTLPQFVRSFFLAQGEGFLRGIFLSCVADGQISAAEWNHLLQTTAKLGISHQEFLQAIHPQARQFVEHVLADAKADNQLTDHEDATLVWLLNNLALPIDFRQYAEAEVRLLRTLTNIQRGRLQPIQIPPGVEIRAGEIMHWHTPAVWRQSRLLNPACTTTTITGC